MLEVSSVSLCMSSTSSISSSSSTASSFGSSSTTFSAENNVSYQMINSEKKSFTLTSYIDGARFFQDIAFLNLTKG